MAAIPVNPAGLALHIATGLPAQPGALAVDTHRDADVPLRAAEELPFEDAAAATIVLGAMVAGLSAGERLNLLIECRRVLRPGGVLTLAVSALRVLGSLVRIVGLDPLDAVEGAVASTPADATDHDAAGGSSAAFTKRDRTLHGDPLVTIAIPAYNARYFAACLDSALAQTYDPLEIVVCDDSADTTIEALVAARQRRRSIRYERNASRLRPRRNFLRTFERASGTFIKFLCDDDLLAPTAVAELLEAFRRAPDVTLATSRRRRIGPESEALPDSPATTPIAARDTLVAGHTLANAMLMAGLNTVGEPTTALFRKDEFEAVATNGFGFRGEHGHGIIDMVMWTSLLLKGHAVYRTTPLSGFRSHPDQRQHDPGMRGRNTESIRSLQRLWLDLGLPALLRPDAILAKPFPPDDTDWRLQPLLGFAARPVERSVRAPAHAHRQRYGNR